MIKKNLTIMLLMLLMIVATVQGEYCEEILTPGLSCNMTTPPLSCSSYTYTIYNQTEMQTTGALTNLDGDIYYLTINLSAGDYLVVLCDNHSREIYVEETNMMLSIIIGAAVVIFFMLYFAFNLDKEHFILKILLSVMAFFGMIIIPSALINGTDATSTTLLKLTIWLPRLFLLYILVYISYVFFLKDFIEKINPIKIKK